MDLLEEKRGTSQVSSKNIDLILQPYFPNSRYLKHSDFLHDPIDNKISLEGKFSIDSSCYAVSSGHFNAVEAILCFNQIGFVFFLEGIERGLLPELGLSTQEEFTQLQKGNFYIAKVEELRFSKPINSKNFRGDLTLTKRKRMDNAFYWFDLDFYDDSGGKAKGSFFTSVVGTPAPYQARERELVLR